MEIELATDEERKTVLEWADKWGLFEEHNALYLSDSIYFVRKQGKPVLACGLMSFEDGKYIRLYGMIKDPDAGSVSYEMTCLIDGLCNKAKSMGYSFIQLFAPSEKLARIYSSNGFRAESKPLIPMRRDL